MLIDSLVLCPPTTSSSETRSNNSGRYTNLVSYTIGIKLRLNFDEKFRKLLVTFTTTKALEKIGSQT